VTGHFQRERQNPPLITVRRARLKDVPRMIALLDDYIRQGEILPRSEDELYRSIREWVVAETEAETRLVGVGSLLVMWHDLAEIRSLVVKPGFQGQKIGQRMVDMLLDDAQKLDLRRVFALTRKPGFFLKQGFKLTKIEQLPRKVRHDCVFCPIFYACDEVALVTELFKNGAVVPRTGPQRSSQ
jgi:amino-acid N-acetyltransferase